MLLLIMSAEAGGCTTPSFGSFPSVQDMHLTGNERDLPIEGIWESNDILRIRTYGLHVGYQIRSYQNLTRIVPLACWQLLMQGPCSIVNSEVYLQEPLLKLWPKTPCKQHEREFELLYAI